MIDAATDYFRRAASTPVWPPHHASQCRRRCPGSEERTSGVMEAKQKQSQYVLDYQLEREQKCRPRSDHSREIELGLDSHLPGNPCCRTPLTSRSRWAVSPRNAGEARQPWTTTASSAHAVPLPGPRRSPTQHGQPWQSRRSL